jgi:hypothetical protein
MTTMPHAEQLEDVQTWGPVGLPRTQGVREGRLVTIATLVCRAQRYVQCARVLQSPRAARCVPRQPVYLISCLCSQGYSSILGPSRRSCYRWARAARQGLEARIPLGYSTATVEPVRYTRVQDPAAAPWPRLGPDLAVLECTYVRPCGLV